MPIKQGFHGIIIEEGGKKEWSAIDDLNRSSHDCGTLPAFLKTASFCRPALKLPNPWSSLCDVGKMGHLFIMGLTRADKSYKITVKQFLSVLPGHSNTPSELLGCKTFFLPLICAHEFSNQMEVQLLISEPRRGTGSRWKRVCFSPSAASRRVFCKSFKPIASQGKATHSIQENLSNTRSIGGDVVIEESFEVLSLQLAPCHEGREFANCLILAEPSQP